MPVSPSQPPRDLREEPSYTEAVDQLGISVRRLDELLLAITWIVAHDPESLPAIPNTPFRMARSQVIVGEPVLRVYFTIGSDELCQLWWVDLAEDVIDEDEAVEDVG